MATSDETPAADFNVAADHAVLEYRLATHVNVEIQREMVHLDFFQPDPVRDGEAVLVGRIALHPKAAAAVAELMLSKVS